MKKGCCHCGTTDAELRPYGPGGAPICFPCIKSTPEREEAAHNALGALMEAAGAASPDGIIVIGTEAGPIPGRLLDMKDPS